MPQFDIFSFFSQLFWVFSGFIILYLLISLYILPSIASILKVRKRKLLQSGGSGSEGSLVFTTQPKDLVVALPTSTNQSLSDSILSGDLKFKTQSISLKVESCREFNFKLLNQAQLSVLLYA